MVISKLKVMTFIGTRPEIIRLSRTMARLDEFLNQIIVHTGQNYDYELNEIFFKELELRKPDYFLGVNTSSLEDSVGDIIRKSGEVMRKETPDAVLSIRRYQFLPCRLYGEKTPYSCFPYGSR